MCHLEVYWMVLWNIGNELSFLLLCLTECSIIGFAYLEFMRYTMFYFTWRNWCIYVTNIWYVLVSELIYEDDTWDHVGMLSCYNSWLQFAKWEVLILPNKVLIWGKCDWLGVSLVILFVLIPILLQWKCMPIVSWLLVH